jgi:hypothetical protein
MIPQAITSSGPYADLWSHLKSMIHALNRALEAKNTRDLSDLDRERLVDVSTLLKSELLQTGESRDPNLALISAASPFDPVDTLGVDLRQFIRHVPEFEQWNSSQKLGTDKKVQKLQSAVDHYIASLMGTWLPNDPPQEEFRILKSLLAAILVQTEAALQV